MGKKKDFFKGKQILFLKVEISHLSSWNSEEIWLEQSYIILLKHKICGTTTTQQTTIQQLKQKD